MGIKSPKPTSSDLKARDPIKGRYWYCKKCMVDSDARFGGLWQRVSSQLKSSTSFDILKPTKPVSLVLFEFAGMEVEKHGSPGGIEV
jgi:hypothetical protein